jgi:cytidylate kinase
VTQALWIGGAPASGKTTVASRIVRRHGLRLYSADTRTSEHRDRALAAGNAAELYLLLNEVVNREAREHGAPTLTVDESRGVAEATRAVEQLFSKASATWRPGARSRPATQSHLARA